MDKTPNNTNQENEIRELAKKSALEKLKQKAVIVNIDEIAEAEARKAADARMTESKENLKGIKNIFKKIWKHTFFDEYYRQKEVNKVRTEIKEKDNIYTGREIEKSGHDEAMKAISERFISEYEGTLSQGEEKKVLESSKEEDKENISKIKTLITEYASGKLDAEAFKSEKNRILDEIYTDKDSKIKGKKPEHNYADNLFEIAKNARIAIEHGAKMEELELDTNIILGKAKSSLKTEAHFNKVDQLTDKMKKSKIGRFISPAVLNTSIGIAYSLSVGLGLKFANSKIAKIGTFGASVAVSSIFAGINESQRITLERAQHGIEMAEGGKFEKDSKKREQMEQFAYKMENSQVLASKLRGLMFEIDKNGKEIPREINPDDLDKIFASLADIEARNSLNVKNRIDLISYSKIENVEKERTDLTILVARAKVELKKRLNGDLKGKLNGKDFNTYLNEQVEVVEKTLLGGESGITAQDKAFKKFKTKEVAKKVAKTAFWGLVIGGTVQETVAFFKDDVQGFGESIFHRDTGATTETPFESLKNWISGNPSHVGLHNAIETSLNGHNFRLPPGFSILENPDGTFDISKGDQIISDNIKLTFDANGNLDSASMARLGESGIVANTTHNLVNVSKTGNVPAEEYLNNHSGSTHEVSRMGWYDNDTPKPIFDQNELKLHWGSGDGIDDNGNYVLDISKMTSDGSFHEQFSVDAQEKMSNGGLKMILSLTNGTQNHIFEVPIDANGKVIIDPNSEIGKLFFAEENGHAVFKGRFAEVVESFGEKDGVERIKTLATLVGEGNDSIIDQISTVEDQVKINLDPSLETEPPYFIPIMSRSPLESLEKQGKSDNKAENLKPVQKDNKPESGNKASNVDDSSSVIDKSTKEKKISKEEYSAMAQDIEMINKKVRNSEGIITVTDSDFKSEYGKKRYSELKDIPDGKPVTFNRSELMKIGDEIDNLLSGKKNIENKKDAKVESKNDKKVTDKEPASVDIEEGNEDEENQVEDPFTKEDLSRVGTEFKTDIGSFKIVEVKKSSSFFGLFNNDRIEAVFKDKDGVERRFSYRKKDLEREFKNGNIKITKRSE